MKKKTQKEETNGVFDNPKRLKNSFTTKTAKFFVHFTGIVLALFMATAFWQIVLDRDDPVEFVNVRVSPQQVQPGGELLLTIEARMRRECHGDVIRYFVDSSGIRHQYAVVQSVVRPEKTPTGTAIFRREIRIPENIAIGMVRHGVVITYRCNAFQYWFPLVVHREYGTFEVIPRIVVTPPPPPPRIYVVPQRRQWRR